MGEEKMRKNHKNPSLEENRLKPSAQDRSWCGPQEEREW